MDDITTDRQIDPSWVPCHECPLDQCEGLKAHDPEREAFLQEFKSGELSLSRGSELLSQGQASQKLYTVLEGVLIRERRLSDGGRQIVNFMFPGDFIGLQSALDGDMEHSVETLTKAKLCVFQRSRFTDLIGRFPAFSYDIIWLAAQEEAALESHLVALGKRNASERVAYLAVFLVQRGIATCMARNGNGARLAIPITQRQIADMLGLSLVHTNRTLQSLRASEILRWDGDGITIDDMDAACRHARFEGLGTELRPFI